MITYEIDLNFLGVLGDFERLSKVLHGHDINECVENGTCPLHYSIEYGKLRALNSKENDRLN